MTLLRKLKPDVSSIWHEVRPLNYFKKDQFWCFSLKETYWKVFDCKKNIVHKINGKSLFSKCQIVLISSPYFLCIETKIQETFKISFSTALEVFFENNKKNQGDKWNLLEKLMQITIVVSGSNRPKSLKVNKKFKLSLRARLSHSADERQSIKKLDFKNNLINRTLNSPCFVNGESEPISSQNFEI